MSTNEDKKNPMQIDELFSPEEEKKLKKDLTIPVPSLPPNANIPLAPQPKKEEEDAPKKPDIYDTVKVPGLPSNVNTPPTGLQKKKSEPAASGEGEARVPSPVGQIIQKLENGEITDDEALELLTQHQLRGNLYDMEPDVLEHAYATGRLSGEQVDKYLDRKESPFWWYLKDVASGATRGVEKGVKSLAESVNEMVNPWLGLAGIKVPEPSFKTGIDPLDKAVDAIDEAVGTPESMAGEIASSIAQFGVALIPAGKLAKAGQVGIKIMNSKYMFALYDAFPKLRGFMIVAVEGAASGAAADYAAFDPYEGRVSDFLKDHGVLPEYLDFMTTDPDNPAALERLKNVLEGLGIGTAIDSILFACKLLRSTAHAKGLSADTLATKAMEHGDDAIPSAYHKVKKAEEDAAAKVGLRKIKVAGEEAVVKPKPDVDFADFVNKAKAKAKAAAEDKAVRDSQAERIFLGVVKGTHKADDNFIRKLESLPDAQEIIRATNDNVDIKPGVQTNEMTELLADEAIKDLADHVGGSSKGILQGMKQISGDIRGATEKAHAMYRVLAGHSDETTKMIKAYLESGRDKKDLARVLEHIKLNQEMQAMCYGVRSEFGRGLQMHNMKIKGSRFNFDDAISLENIDEFMKENAGTVEKALKAIVEADGLKNRMKATRTLGANGILRWVLSLVQANLLWSPATHLVNITSQTAALAFKATSRTLGRLVIAGLHRDAGQLVAMTKEWMGIIDALGTCFKVAKFGEKVGDVVKSRKTFRQAFLEDESVGSFWRATILRDGIIDPSTKLMDDPRLITPFYQKSWIGKLGTVLDATLKLPFNLLTGVDEVFKTMGTMYRYNGLVIDQGLSYGFRGADLDNHLTLLKRNIDPQMYKKALETGKEITFQDTLGDNSAWLGRKLRDNPIGLGMSILFTPFYKTSVNLVKYAYKNTALGLASKGVRESLAKGGVDAVETATRIVAGTSAMAYAAYLYSEGKITGRLPANMRDTNRAAGLQEYSYFVESTKKWVTYRRTDPFGMWLAMAADAFQAYDKLGVVYSDANQQLPEDEQVTEGDVITALLMAFVNPATSGTWIKGTGDLFRMFGNIQSGRSTGEQVEKFGMSKLDTLVPAKTGIDWYRGEFGVDEYLREVQGLLDMFTKKFGDTTELFPRRDPIYGEPIKKEPRLAHMLRQTELTEDPVLRELVGLQVNIQPPKDYLRLEGVKVVLSPENVDKFQELYSRIPVKRVLTDLINSDVYQNIPNTATKKKVIKRYLNAFRQAAAQALLSKSQEVTKDLIDAALQKARVEAGYDMSGDTEDALTRASRMFAR